MERPAPQKDLRSAGHPEAHQSLCYAGKPSGIIELCGAVCSAF